MKKRILAVLLCICMMLPLLPTATFAAEPQSVATLTTDTTLTQAFPDANFRAYIKTLLTADTHYASSNEKLTQAGIEKIKAITEIWCNNKSISSLAGIEHFTALENLFCFDNQLTSLDVSACTALTVFSC